MSPRSTGAALAKALKLKVKDFLALKTLSGYDPFGSPEETMHFATLAAEMTRSGLSSAQISYVVRHVAMGSGQGETEPHEATIVGLARNLRDGLTAIVRDNGSSRIPRGTLTAQKLALLYDSSVVDHNGELSTARSNYSAPLIILPAAVTFPASLVKKVIFDPIAQLLNCKSPLTSADRSTLFSLSADPAYHAAVDSLYKDPSTSLRR